MPFKTVNLLKRNFIEKNCQNKPSRSVVKIPSETIPSASVSLHRVTWLLCYRAQVYVLYNLSLFEIGISDFPLCLIFDIRYVWYKVQNPIESRRKYLFGRIWC